MKVKVAVISAAFLVALTAVAMAESGGYPASPSHGIIGQNPDGTPRYGSEPDKGKNPSGNSLGRTGPKASDDRKDGTGAQDANKGQDRR